MFRYALGSKEDISERVVGIVGCLLIEPAASIDEVVSPFMCHLLYQSSIAFLESCQTEDSWNRLLVLKRVLEILDRRIGDRRQQVYLIPR